MRNGTVLQFLSMLPGSMRHENKSLASRVKPRNGNAIAP
jgi:hypothetical protein